MTGMTPHVTSVNVGQPESVGFAGRFGRSAIRKHAVTGPVAVHALGVAGDRVANTKHHGGVHQAVYAFAQEDLAFWAGELGRPVEPGRFGENLTTLGIDVNEAVLGERWRVGTVLLEVCEVRIPCSVFKGWMGESGYDDRAWVKRFTAQARPGPYLRVLEEGTLQAGDEIVVEHRPDHGVTVSTMFRAFTTDRSLMPRLLDVPCLPPYIHEQARAYVAATVA